MPSYNRGELLKRAVMSILNQTHPNWALYVVDDCSTCAITLDTLDWIRSLNDERVFVLKNIENCGVNKTRNRALDLIQKQTDSSFVTLLDDDDYFVPSAFEKIPQSVTQSPCNWFIANCIDEQGRPVSKIKKYGAGNYLYDYMYGRNLRGDVAHFIKSDIALHHRFTELFKNGEEWYWFSQIAKTTDFIALNLGLKIVKYLPGGLSDKAENNRHKLDVFSLKVSATEGLAPSLKAVQQQSFARELIIADRVDEGLKMLKTCWPYKWWSFHWCRWYLFALYKLGRDLFI
jgi:glycosyltransferase involved in cell wall biosynthesis